MAKPTLHRHGCAKCRKTFEDACEEPRENRGLCFLCRTGKPGLHDQLNTWTPGSCCPMNTRPARRQKGFDEYATYKLSKGCSWWICTVCARTFIYKPKEQMS